MAPPAASQSSDSSKAEAYSNLSRFSLEHGDARRGAYQRGMVHLLSIVDTEPQPARQNTGYGSFSLRRENATELERFAYKAKLQ